MDKYNNPSGNTNSNDNNPWDYRPDQIDDTQEIPVVDNTEPTEENAASNDPDHIPEYTPSSYYNASETEHKSHIGRNLFIGAVAVAAVAGAVAMFSGNQVKATQPNTSATAPATHEQKKYTGGYKYIHAENDTNVEQPLEPDANKIQEYKETEPYVDGLSVTEFSNYCGFDNLSESYQYRGETISGALEACIEDMGYNVPSSGIRTTPDGVLCITSLGEFELGTNTDSFGEIQVLAQIENNIFNIQLSIFPFSPDTDRVLEYNSDVVPTPDEARQMLADNNML